MGVKQVVGLLSVALVLHLVAGSGWSVEGLSGGAVAVEPIAVDPPGGGGGGGAKPCSGDSSNKNCPSLNTSGGLGPSCTVSYAYYTQPTSGTWHNTKGLSDTACAQPSANHPNVQPPPPECGQISFDGPADGCDSKPAKPTPAPPVNPNPVVQD